MKYSGATGTFPSIFPYQTSMRRSHAILGLIALLTASPLAAQNGSGDSDLPEVPFAPYERTEYAVRYGPVPAGSMDIRLAGVVTYRNRPAYHIVFDARTNKSISYVYELDTHEEAWFDAVKFHSLRYKKRSVENDTPRERDYRFDQERNVRIQPDGEEKPASPRAVDQLSFMYYLRLLPLKPGAKIVLRNQADPDDNPLTLRVLGRERVKVPIGAFETLVIDLDLKTDSGVFKKGGENRIWVTDDARKLPVKFSSKIGLGSFQAELVDYDRGESASSP